MTSPAPVRRWRRTARTAPASGPSPAPRAGRERWSTGRPHRHDPGAVGGTGGHRVGAEGEVAAHSGHRLGLSVGGMPSGRRGPWTARFEDRGLALHGPRAAVTSTANGPRRAASPRRARGVDERHHLGHEGGVHGERGHASPVERRESCCTRRSISSGPHSTVRARASASGTQAAAERAQVGELAHLGSGAVVASTEPSIVVTVNSIRLRPCASRPNAAW